MPTKDKRPKPPHPVLANARKADRHLILSRLPLTSLPSDVRRLLVQHQCPEADTALVRPVYQHELHSRGTWLVHFQSKESVPEALSLLKGAVMAGRPIAATRRHPSSTDPPLDTVLEAHMVPYQSSIREALLERQADYPGFSPNGSGQCVGIYGLPKTATDGHVHGILRGLGFDHQLNAMRWSKNKSDKSNAPTAVVQLKDQLEARRLVRVLNRSWRPILSLSRTRMLLRAAVLW